MIYHFKNYFIFHFSFYEFFLLRSSYRYDWDIDGGKRAAGYTHVYVYIYTYALYKYKYIYKRARQTRSRDYRPWKYRWRLWQRPTCILHHPTLIRWLLVVVMWTIVTMYINFCTSIYRHTYIYTYTLTRHPLKKYCLVTPKKIEP